MSDIPLFDEPTPAADLQNVLNILINEINLLLGTSAVINASVLYSSRLVASLTSIPTAIVTFQTAGYYTRGDGGGALYISASGTTLGGFQSHDGRWWQLGTQQLNVRMFGAKGDGVTNDTSAMTDAFNAIPDHGTLNIPKGNFLVSGSSSAIFDRPPDSILNIIGEGYGSRILVAPTTGLSTSVFRFRATIGVRGFVFRDFTIEAASTPAALHGIYFDLTANDTGWFYGGTIERLLVSLVNSNIANGTSIRSAANVTHNTGGLAYSTIRDCIIESAFFHYVGDNIALEHNTIVNELDGAVGVYAHNVAGAANFQVIGNVIACKRGEVYFDGGTAPVFAFNELETPSSAGTTTAPNNAMLDIAGDISAVVSPCIIGNSIDSLVGTGDPNPIRFGTVTNGVIGDGNHLLTSGMGVKCIVTTTFTQDLLVGFSNFIENFVNVPDSILDLGDRTRFAWGGQAILSAQVLSGSALPLTSGVGLSIANLDLAAGTYDIDIEAWFKPAAGTSISSLYVSVSEVDNTLNGSPEQFAASLFAPVVPGAGNDISQYLGPFRITTTGPSSVLYFVAVAGFSVGALGGYGTIRARQVR